METLKKWYVMVAVILFTVAFPIAGHTPLQWGLRGLGMILRAANDLAN